MVCINKLGQFVTLVNSSLTREVSKVSKYSRVVLRGDILASPLPDVISGAKAKQTTFHKYRYKQWAFGTKNCFVFVKYKMCP